MKEWYHKQEEGSSQTWWHMPVTVGGKRLEPKGSRVQRHPRLYIELEASLRYMRPCLKKQTNQQGSRSFVPSSPLLKRPRPPHHVQRHPVQSPAALEASLSPRCEPQAARASGREGIRTVKKAGLEGPPGRLIFGLDLTFPSLSTPAVCPEATRTPSGCTARLSGGRRTRGKGVSRDHPRHLHLA